MPPTWTTLKAHSTSSPEFDGFLDASLYSLLPPAGLLPEFDGVDQADPNCVVIGDAAEKFSYQNLNEAFRVLTGLEKPVLFSLGQG